MFKVNNKYTRTTPYLTPCFGISIVHFEHVIAGWEMLDKMFKKKLYWNAGKLFPVHLWEFSCKSESINPFLPKVLFWSPWKYQKTNSFVMFTALKVSVFGVILVCIFPYSVQMRENTDQNNSKYRQILRSVPG